MTEGPVIEISAAKPAELDAIFGLLSEAFLLPPVAAREIFLADPYFNIENKRVLRVDGEVVSCLNVHDTVCWLGAGKGRVAGIAGVTTRPAERRKGYAAQLLRATLDTLRERGFALTALMPFSFPYYRQFGYEQAGFAYRYLTAPQHLPLFPESRHVRATRHEDIPQCVRLYDSHTNGRAFYCLRDTKRWQYLFQYVKQRVVFEVQQQIEGYLLYEFQASALPAAGSQPTGTTLPPTLRILEMVAANEMARRGLIGYLAQQINMGCIEYEARFADLMTSGLLHPTAAEAPSLASIEVVPFLMARILDFRTVLETLALEWRGFRGEIALTLTDETLPDGMVSVLVRGAEAGITVQEIPAAQANTSSDQLFADVRVWSQVVVGYQSGSDSVALGKLRASSPYAANFASERFPCRDPFLPPADRF